MKKSYKYLYLEAVNTLKQVVRTNNEIYKRLDIKTDTKIAEDLRTPNYIVKTKYTLNKDNELFSALFIPENLIYIFK